MTGEGEKCLGEEGDTAVVDPGEETVGNADDGKEDDEDEEDDDEDDDDDEEGLVTK